MELWIALIGICSAVITIGLTNYFAKKNQLKFEERKLKEQYYTAFIQAVSNSVVLNQDTFNWKGEFEITKSALSFWTGEIQAILFK